MSQDLHETARPILYWRPGCPFCAALKTKLRVARVRYTAVNIYEDPDAAAYVRSVNNGNELVPTVRIGERSLSNPSLRQVKQALAARSS